MPSKKKISIDLDGILYDQVIARAKDIDLTTSALVRNALEDYLGIKPPLEPKSYEIGSGEPIPDHSDAEYWNVKLKEIAAMRPIDGWSALKHATNGIEIPKYLFADRKNLAQWLAEHVQ